MNDHADIATGSWEINGPYPLSTFPELGPFVYYIQCGAFIKIGTSINPEKRCDQLRRGGKAIRPSIWVEDPRLIAYIPGNVAKERELHQQFASHRDNGEWFLMNQDLIEHVFEAQAHQCLMELEVHVDYRDKKIAAGEWPAIDVNLAAMYQQHVSTKERLAPEWAEDFAA
jgi:hypothetical protein